MKVTDVWRYPVKTGMHRLDSGQFAVEDCLNSIAGNIHRDFDQKLASK